MSKEHDLKRRRLAPEPRAGTTPAETRRIAPGKVTRTSKLEHDRKRTLQCKAPVAEACTAARDRRSALELTMDPWMDMAHRGLAALEQASTGAGTIGDDTQHLPAPSGGQPMPAEVQAKMEHAFGADFSAVRIHQGAHAEALGALAYAQGADIHFAPGQYQPQSLRGQEILGHELAHVVQQAQGRVSTARQAKGGVINDDPSLEREADELGAKAARGEQASSSLMPVRSTIQARSIQCVKIPVPSEKKASAWETEDIKTEEQLSRLREILETFYNNNPGKQARSTFEKRIKSAITTAKRTEESCFLEKVWNMAHSFSNRHAANDTEVKLPEEWQGKGERRERKEKQAQIGSDTVLDETWKCDAFDSMDTMYRLLNVEYLADEANQERIARAVWMLQKEGKQLGDNQYVDFFRDALKYVRQMSDSLRQSGAIRLSAQFKKIGASSLKKGKKDFANFRGALAEIIDCLCSAVSNPNLQSISMGGKMKGLRNECYTGVSDGYQNSVDVDRTETLKDGSKWYIEVKANATAALHHMSKVGQLDRLLSVVQQRNADDESGARDRTPGLSERKMAISIVCPDSWGLLFTNPCARLYAERGMHLIIGGVTFTPDELRKIESQIPPKGTTKRNRKNIIEFFPAPHILKAQGCTFSLRQLALFTEHDPLNDDQRWALGLKIPASSDRAEEK